MDFEDRLKNHLHTQSNEVHIEPATVGDVADRSNSRRQRRMAGSAIAVAVVLMGIGGFVLGGNGDNTPVSVSEFAEDQDDQTNEGGEPTDQDPATLATGPLEFDDVSNGNSPGGFNVFTNVVGPDGVYYVLSTSPGAPESEEYDWRADTLYSFDNDWTATDFGDRFVTDFGHSGDLLYALSTGSASVDQPAIGTSSDGGNNWTWTPIDVADSLGTELQFSTATSGDRLLIIASSNGFPMYDEGTTLAIEAGAPIDLDVHEVINVDHVGIRWIDRPEQSKCWAELDRIYREALPDEGELIPFPFDEQGLEFEDLTDEQRAQIDEWEIANAKAYAELSKKVGDLAGCERFGECFEESQALQMELYSGDQDYPEDGDEQAIRQFEEEMQQREESFNAWQEESGCDEELAHNEDAYEEQYRNAQSATWEELGVTIPESWTSQHEAAMFANGDVVSLGPVFPGEQGYLLNVTASANGSFEAQFELPYEFDEYENEFSDFPTEASIELPEGVRYISPDGVNWENTGISPITWQQPVVFNGGSFSINWENHEPNGAPPSLMRNGEEIAIDEMLGDSGIDATNLHLSQVVAGDYGVVAWATRWEEPQDEIADDFMPDIDTVVFFSRDGINWAATEIPGHDVYNVAVGADSVMVFAVDPNKANNPDTPQPVYIGRAS